MLKETPSTVAITSITSLNMEPITTHNTHVTDKTLSNHSLMQCPTQTPVVSQSFLVVHSLSKTL